MLTIQALLAIAGKRPRKPQKLAKPTRSNRRAELEYTAALLKIVSEIESAAQKRILPLLKRDRLQYERIAKDAALTADGIASSINQAFDLMAADLGSIDRIALRLAAQAVTRQVNATDDQLMRSVANAIGVSIDLMSGIRQLDVRNDVEAATLQNAQLIKDIPRAATERMKNAVLNDVAMGRRYEDIAEDVQKVLNVTEARAKVIARDQMAKVNASITESKQVALGITSYQWSTSNDERVRDTHAAQDGKVFRWDSPPSDTGHPGDDVMCRCVAVPVIEFEKA
jgi:SPP1 gp7 family putative phage head morphogenesis protein